MSRPTFAQINTTALLHNVHRVREFAPNKKIIAMVKANAYGSHLPAVVNTLEGQVDALGVACLEEAMQIRKLGVRTPCVLFQGVFNQEEYKIASLENFQCVIHQQQQVEWLINSNLPTKLKVWIKINTGMQRLGFEVEEYQKVYHTLLHSTSVHHEIGVMTHLACADEPCHPSNALQLARFNAINFPPQVVRSVANSAAIIALPHTHADVVRPGIMLYGISPFPEQTGQELGLIPVVSLKSKITAIHNYPANVPIGYGNTWSTPESSRIGVVSIGYGDGYPRHIKENTPVWLNGKLVPIVGRVSMDILTINITYCQNVNLGDSVELWGVHLPIEEIAKCAGTIPYELITQLTMRVHTV